MGAHSRANRRFGAFVALLLLLVLGLGIRLVDFQVVQADEIKQRAEEKLNKTLNIKSRSTDNNWKLTARNNLFYTNGSFLNKVKGRIILIYISYIN